MPEPKTAVASDAPLILASPAADPDKVGITRQATAPPGRWVVVVTTVPVVPVVTGGAGVTGRSMVAIVFPKVCTSGEVMPSIVASLNCAPTGAMTSMLTRLLSDAEPVTFAGSPRKVVVTVFGLRESRSMVKAHGAPALACGSVMSAATVVTG